MKEKGPEIPCTRIEECSAESKAPTEDWSSNDVLAAWFGFPYILVPTKC